MASTDRYYTNSSSYTYNARAESSSSSAARPHHRLPAHYQTSSTSSHQYRPADHRDYHSTSSSSSSSHQYRPADHRDYHSTSSSSSPHVRLPAGYQDRYASSSSTSHQSPTSDYRRYPGTASSSSTPTYHTPRLGGSSTASRASSSTRREPLTPGEARNEVFDLRQRLQNVEENSPGGISWLGLGRSAKKAAYRELFEDALMLRERVSRGNRSTTMSMFSGETGMDPLEEEIDEMLKIIEKEL